MSETFLFLLKEKASLLTTLADTIKAEKEQLEKKSTEEMEGLKKEMEGLKKEMDEKAADCIEKGKLILKVSVTEWFSESGLLA